jgi:pyruvate dehydrogenase kinase 2/3/4
MIFELVKNSLRAVQERCMDGDEDSPPIRVVVADGLEDVTIKVWFKLTCITLYISVVV